MNKKTMLKNIATGEVVFVEVNRNGAVTVTIDVNHPTKEPTTNVYNEEFTLEDVVHQFVTSGWVDVTDKHAVFKHEVTVEVPMDIKKAIKDYSLASKEESAAKTKKDKIKKRIQEFMEKHGLDHVEGVDGFEAKLTDTVKTGSTNTFTTYDVREVQHILPSHLFNKVAVLKIDATKLRDLMKEKNMKAETKDKLEEAKIYHGASTRFTVKQN
ncbi:hypothetical protein BI004_gp225 [Bacillus phage NotTheCreek]|uniref:Uncharacterized protein n=3 Tax=Wphvirus TaxID=1922327 RepID=A0A222Z356_9CAUD|nr:hypothetical protein FP72_gp222 [Bacillus phage Hakuna]YP_009279397.1 hypothetical protein BIZ89_gp230 [Bacillus phage Kida]YP_009281028.1 hypothetical protein SAGEFAYGE_225 [Bacillus phage SageFayge]YP_009284553.1 hypothetical protein BI004_gp225 [Bacillus phage NotTheCreek]ASR78474.1 hypothetical protein PPISBEST_227 [Bacillus phage PPIsBest]QDH49501.1 hypothetical protein PHIREBALL_227 [Bacillus phage Phireball]QDH50208.1 hypothetical protein ALPS_222 [Bacillus phage ALPS]ULF49135.1 hy